MDFTCILDSKLYVKNNKRYIDLLLPYDVLERVSRIHVSCASQLVKDRIQMPLNDRVLTVKVPFRNNRVSCLVKGHKTIYEMEVGETVDVKIQWCGVWEFKDFCGVAWKLSQLSLPN